MPFQVTNPESIELIRKMIKVQMEHTTDMRVICDALLQMLGMCIVGMSQYDPHVARGLYSTIGDNLTDIIIEELKNKPENLEEVKAKAEIVLADLDVENKWKM